jgi:energy-coupling factor transporter ATP-binding protein EcfA2
VVKLANLANTNNNNAIQNTSDFEIPRGYICTLDITSIEGKMQLATALNGAESMREKVGETLRVVDIVTTQGVRARTETECVNTYLICEDGSVYFSQSDGIARSVKVLVALFTNPATGEFMNPVEQGVGFMVKEQVLQNGNTLKTVVPVKLS